MTQALLRGEAKNADAEMERAPRLQPRGSTTFQTPHHQRHESYRPNAANDQQRVQQNDPLAQREQTLFRRHSEAQIVVARARLEQFKLLVLDKYQGPCLTPRAGEIIEQFVPFVAIACGHQGSFCTMIEEIRAMYAPLVEPDEAEEIIERTLLNPPHYDSASVGKRWDVTPEQYERLGLTHITPAGWGSRKLKGYRKKRRNTRVKDKRHSSQESKTRRELSITQLAPWTLPEAPCTSRPGFYRLPKEGQDALVARARAEAALRP